MDGLDSGAAKVAGIVLTPELTQDGTIIGTADVASDLQTNNADAANYPLLSWNLGNPDIPGDGLHAQCAITNAAGQHLSGAAGCIFIPVVQSNP
jgi:hypothetical protein